MSGYTCEYHTRPGGECCGQPAEHHEINGISYFLCDDHKPSLPRDQIVEKPTRKIIQLVVGSFHRDDKIYDLLALCDDGTIWGSGFDEWHQIKGITVE